MARWKSGLEDPLHARFHVGHNLEGHLPLTVDCFRQWGNAALRLETRLQEYAEEDDQSTPTGELRGTVDLFLENNPPADQDDYVVRMQNGRHQVVEFWLRRAMCDHDDGLEG